MFVVVVVDRCSGTSRKKTLLTARPLPVIEDDCRVWRSRELLSWHPYMSAQMWLQATNPYIISYYFKTRKQESAVHI